MSEDIFSFIDQQVPVFTKNCQKGIKYLQQNGLNIILHLPSGKQMLQQIEEMHKRGQIDKKQYEEMKKSFSSKEMPTHTQYAVLSPGFEPDTVLPRPYAFDTADGGKIELTTSFMNRFDIYTHYDLQRMVRNVSVVLSNFDGPMEKDNFGLHLDRLRNWLKKNASKAIPGFEGLVEFIVAMRIIHDMMLLKWEISPNDFYNAGIIFGVVFKLWG